MNTQKKSIDGMNSFVVKIDLGEKEKFATYMMPDGDLKDQFWFSMTSDGCRMFVEKIPMGASISFEASGSTYSVKYKKRNILTSIMFPNYHSTNLYSKII
ncbi:MAG: hypothetical protein QXU18_16000 [Thermoplasmatales archaeon]